MSCRSVSLPCFQLLPPVSLLPMWSRRYELHVTTLVPSVKRLRSSCSSGSFRLWEQSLLFFSPAAIRKKGLESTAARKNNKTKHPLLRGEITVTPIEGPQIIASCPRFHTI